MLKTQDLASSEQRQQYNQLKRAGDKWRRDADALRAVSEELRSAYETHKGDCAMGRYEALKTMIKEAGSGYKTVVERNERKADDPHCGGNRWSGRREDIKALAVRASLIAKMTTNEMTSEIGRMSQRLERLQAEYRVYRDSLETLMRDYKDSKKHTPPERYFALRDMIKLATRAKS
ncbi:hypothetical protein LSAT2_019128 [Lamellibrachia satsuma]|nr:hypothetical protein LSAT2_019128 [Lamellibrachia satsuma]